jgi:DNA-binding CsgD family transcriptional regulator
MIALLRRFLVDAPRHLAAVRSGGGSLTPQLALAAGGRPAALLPRADPRELISSLTQAERAVVSLLASGRAPKQVASELSIAVPTVRSRILSARRKTGARTMEQLVCLYAEGGGA